MTEEAKSPTLFPEGALPPAVEPAPKPVRERRARTKKKDHKLTQTVTDPDTHEAEHVTPTLELKASHRKSLARTREKFNKQLNRFARQTGKNPNDVEEGLKAELDFTREELATTPFDLEDAKRALLDEVVKPDEAWILGIHTLDEGSVENEDLGFQLLARAKILAKRLRIMDLRYTFAEMTFHNERAKYTRAESKRLREAMGIIHFSRSGRIGEPEPRPRTRPA